jgi:hypothetical protein
METKDSITARPWFVCPSWSAVAPLLADAIARNGDYGDEAAAARAELMRLAAAMDGYVNAVAALRRLHLAVTMRPTGGLSHAERAALDHARSTLNTLEAAE